MAELRSAAERRLVSLREYDSVLVFNGSICLGLTAALLFGEPAGGLFFGALALLSFAAGHRLRRFGRALENALPALERPSAQDTGPAVAERVRLSVWRIVAG